MDLTTNFFIAVGLAMDAFAVSLGVGTCQQANHRRSKLRLAFHFGIFQAFMPVLGCRFGKRMEVLGGLILIGIGLRILFSHLIPA
jgi:putative Mn2+ efflux pump MntP